jgi:hypothetical protein
MVHICATHRHIHVARLPFRPSTTSVLLVGNGGVGPTAPTACILGPVLVHVCLYQGRKAYGPFHPQPR